MVQVGDDRYSSAQDVIDSDAIVGTQVGTTIPRVVFHSRRDLCGADTRTESHFALV